MFPATSTRISPGAAFPEHNFVFTDQFRDLLKTYRSGTQIPL